MFRIACMGLFIVLTACAAHRPVKVSCSSHLVRINAKPPVAQPAPSNPVDAAQPKEAGPEEHTEEVPR